MLGDFRIGPWLVQPQLNSISDSEKTIRIEPKVIEVLVCLAEHAGEVLSKDQIIEVVWGGTFVADSSLVRAIYELRKNLEDDPAAPRFIQTIPGRGYRLIAQLLPGERAGESRYQILRPIGHGAMGEVFLARDRLLERKVVLKFMLRELEADETARRPFLQEARLAAMLEHPYICSIHDAGELAGRTFIAMEYVEGQTLKERLKKGRLPVAEALRVARQVAEALDKAHGTGIIHRDLKPANIMLTPQGHAKVMDFGLAKSVAGRLDEDGTVTGPPETRPGDIAGTVAYMSPEQARGKALDVRSDLFSLGVVLYEMVTGELPFAGETTAIVFDKILHQPALPPNRLSPRLPDGVEEVVARALEKNPEVRYQSARELLDDLNRLEPAAGVTQVPAKLSERTKALRKTLGMLCVFLLAFSGLIWWSPLAPEAPQEPFQPTPFTTYPGWEFSPAFSPQGEWVALVRAFGGRKDTDIWLKRVNGDDEINRTESPGVSEGSPVWSPTGREIAFLRFQTDGVEIVTAPVFGGPTRVRYSGGPRITRLDWSPDGEHFVFSGSLTGDGPSRLYRLPVGSDQPQPLTNPGAGLFGDFDARYSPEGRHLAFVRQEDSGIRDLYVVPAEGGEPVQLTRGAFIWTPAWTPDGKEIVYTHGHDPSRYNLRRISVFGGKSYPVGIERAFGPHVSPVGGLLAYTRLEVQSDVIRTPLPSSPPDRPAPSVAVASSTWRSDSPQISPDGNWLAFRSNRTGGSRIWVARADGTDPYVVTDFHGGTARWSPDSRRIAFDSPKEGNSDIFVVDRGGGAAWRVAAWDSEEVLPSWSRDGRWIYFSSDRTGKRQIWKLPCQGGEAIRITSQGGREALEGPLGEWVYYVKELFGKPSLWRARADGNGNESLFLEEDIYWGSWTIVEEGIYWLAREHQHYTSGPYALKFFDFASQNTVTLCSLEDNPIRRAVDFFPVSQHFTLAPDRSYFLWVGGRRSLDIMLVESFR